MEIMRYNRGIDKRLFERTRHGEEIRWHVQDVYRLPGRQRKDDKGRVSSTEPGLDPRPTSGSSIHLEDRSQISLSTGPDERKQ